ncbi:MAG TPA: hypothetical protein VFQ70_03890 [Candidatus Saccharimonadaceae bacterium]|nr:hypothetical protein [Candidatus Saccharimonadaceae bacterium]
MSVHFAQASYPLPVSRRLLSARYTLAAFFIIIVLAQLFAFSKLGATIQALVPMFSLRACQVTATVAVVLEVATLPGLLIVALSPLARVLSRIAGPLVLALWYGLVYCGIRTAHVPNSGLLGSDVRVTADFWTLLAVMIIFVITCAIQYFDIRAQGVQLRKNPTK